MTGLQLEVETFGIYQLATHPDWQVRKDLDAGTIERYASIYKAGGVLPALEVARIDETLFVVDGAHRLEAAKQAGRNRLDCKVVATTSDEAMWRAAQANLEHGLPLKKRELRNVLRAFVKAGRHRKKRGLLSYREIATTALGGAVGHTTVRGWIEKDFPKLFAAMAGVEGQGYDGIGPTWKRPTVTSGTVAHRHLDSLLAILPALGQGEQEEVMQRLRDVINPPEDHDYF